MRKGTNIIMISIFTFTLFLFQSCAAEFINEYSTYQDFNYRLKEDWLIEKIFLLVSIGGMFGGFVYALETKDTYTIKKSDKLIDTGIWGHIFIGFCGGLVALAVILSVFGLDLSSITTSNSPHFTSIKYTFYILAIGILGGYSGLPIISLISNAAIKKVQLEVDKLKKDTEKEVDNLKKSEEHLQKIVKNFEEKLKLKNDELHQVTMTSILLTAESYARNGSFDEAVDIITKQFLPIDTKQPKAYFWLAFAEKRRGNIKKAIECIQQSLAIKASRTGYFNLACYLALDDRPVDEVVQALQSGWAMATTKNEQEKFKENLQKDVDFDKIRVDPRFVAFEQVLGISK